MNPEVVLLNPELSAWLLEEHAPVPGWEPEPPAANVRCDPKLVRRLSEVARPSGDVGRRFVDGYPVIHHPRGQPIATAAGTAWMAVRSDLPAGALAIARAYLPDLTRHGWVELDPWAANSAFARATDLLRAHLARAYKLAEAGT